MTSFNEWPETTVVEPSSSWDDPYLYLKIVFASLLTIRSSSSSESAPRSTLDTALAQLLKKAKGANVSPGLFAGGHFSRRSRVKILGLPANRLGAGSPLTQLPHLFGVEESGLDERFNHFIWRGFCQRGP